uniref:Ig-like domain-containing protein n=1 Tax=Pundamilia nyererei TaxID=303518 RepID=A0A3B4H8H0_9CICH
IKSCFYFAVNGATYKKLGDEAVLSPGSMPNLITSITWKHGPDIAVEWYGKETFAYREFKGTFNSRCKLDFNTGALTISNLTVKDSGIYTAEINNRVMNPTKITVISAVPKPTVSKSCNPEMTICTLTCEAQAITGVEPVIYSWVISAKQRVQSSSNQLSIDDTKWFGKPISCQLENPVSSERNMCIILVNIYSVINLFFLCCRKFCCYVHTTSIYCIADCGGPVWLLYLAQAHKS